MHTSVYVWRDLAPLVRRFCREHGVGFNEVVNRARHWKATMEYHRTKDPLHVAALLGHKKTRKHPNLRATRQKPIQRHR